MGTGRRQIKHRAAWLQERRCGRMQPLRSGTGMKSAAESRPNFSLGQRRRRDCSTAAPRTGGMHAHRPSWPSAGQAPLRGSGKPARRTLPSRPAFRRVHCRKAAFVRESYLPGQKPLRSRCACCRIQSQLVKAPASCRFRAFSGVRYILFVTNTALRHHFRHMCPIHTIITAIPPAPRLRPHR